MIESILWGKPTPLTPIEVHEVPVPIPDLAPGLEGFRLAVVSDLHFGRFIREEFARHVVALVNGLKPDVVLLLGDIVNNRPRQAPPCAAILSALRAPLGVLACLGNHDYYAGRRTVVAALEEVGITVLVNQHRRLQVAGAELVVAGLDDFRRGRPDVSATYLELDDRLPVIVMSHNPDQAEYWDGPHRVDLMISGHTHGGQITLGGWPLVTRTRHRRYYRGLVKGPCFPVYTSRGLGVVGLPLRVGSRPEIPILRLERLGLGA